MAVSLGFVLVASALARLIAGPVGNAVVDGGQAVAYAQDPTIPDLPGKLVYARSSNLTPAGISQDLFLSDADGDGESILTTFRTENPVGEENPRWSPDGTEIIYDTLSTDGNSATIWRIPFGGGTPTPVVVNEGHGHPAWRPDGKAIAYTGAHKPADSKDKGEFDLKIWENGSSRLLAGAANLDESYPDWSPDGTQIVYQAIVVSGGMPRGLGFGIRVMNADGSNDRELVNTAGFSEVFPRWSPDGKKIAFVTFRGDAPYGSGQLQILDVESGQVSTRVVGIAGPASWSPDGQWLLVCGIVGGGPTTPTPIARTGSGPEQPSELLGLYLYNLEDGQMYRLKGYAGGGPAKPGQGEFGFQPDWTKGTLTPTPIVTNTPTRTNTPVPTNTPLATPTYTPSPTSEFTPTDLPTNTPVPPKGIFIPIAAKNHELYPTATATAEGGQTPTAAAETPTPGR